MNYHTFFSKIRKDVEKLSSAAVVFVALEINFILFMYSIPEALRYKTATFQFCPVPFILYNFEH